MSLRTKADKNHFWYVTKLLELDHSGIAYLHLVLHRYIDEMLFYSINNFLRLIIFYFANISIFFKVFFKTYSSIFQNLGTVVKWWFLHMLILLYICKNRSNSKRIICIYSLQLLWIHVKNSEIHKKSFNFIGIKNNPSQATL